MMLGANKSVADKIQQWHIDHPELSAMPPEVLAEFSKLAPNSPLIAKEQQNITDVRNRISDSHNNNLDLNQKDLNWQKYGNNTNNGINSNNTDQNKTTQIDESKLSEETKNFLKKTDPDAYARGVANFKEAQDQEKFPSMYSDISHTAGGSNMSKDQLDAYASRAKLAEQPLEEKHNNLTPIMTGNGFVQEKSARENLLDFQRNNAPILEKVLNQTRTNPLFAAGDAGITVNAAGQGFHLALPVAAAMDAGLSTPEKSIKDEYIRLATEVANSDARINSGMAPGKIPVGEYQRAFGAYFNPNMSLESQAHAARISAANLDHNQQIWDAENKGMKNVSPISLTPFNDIHQNSKLINGDPSITDPNDPSKNGINKNFLNIRSGLNQYFQKKVNPNGGNKP